MVWDERGRKNTDGAGRKVDPHTAAQPPAYFTAPYPDPGPGTNLMTVSLREISFLIRV